MEPSTNITKKANKRKITSLKATTDISSLMLITQKTRKLNPPPNLTIRNKKSHCSQENINQEKSNTQDVSDKKNEIMKQTRSSPSSIIQTKNRFEVLQEQEASLTQLQNHLQPTPTKKSIVQKSILENIRKKNEELRNKARRHTTSLVGTAHDQNKTKDIRINSQSPPPLRLTE